MQTDNHPTDNGTLNQALNKVLQEQQEQKSWVANCQKLVREQQEKIAALEQQVQALKGKPATPDTVSLEAFQSSVEELKRVIQTQPKNIEQRFIRERNVFPASWKAGDFKMIFDTVLKWVIVLIVVLWITSFINARWRTGETARVTHPEVKAYGENQF